MKVHFCALTPDCSIGGRCHRFHIDTRWGNLGIAYLPGSRFVGRYGVGLYWVAWERREQ